MIGNGEKVTTSMKGNSTMLQSFINDNYKTEKSLPSGHACNTGHGMITNIPINNKYQSQPHINNTWAIVLLTHQVKPCCGKI